MQTNNYVANVCRSAISNTSTCLGCILNLTLSPSPLLMKFWGVKYITKDDVNHLIASIKTTYTLTEDWTGDLYCGIVLSWNCINRTVDTSMPSYIKKKIQEYNHVIAKRNQMCPYALAPKQFGTEAQAPFPTNDSPRLDKAGIRRLPRIMDSILYYARAVDMTLSMALSTIASKQIKASEKTLEKCTQLFDYLAMHSDAKIRYYTSDMVMNIHYDASYLLKANAPSRTCGHFFMGWLPKDNKWIKLNGAFHLDSSILCFIVASAAEAELDALFHNCQTGIIFPSILEDLGHHQPKTPVHCNNTTAVGIANDSVKRRWSRSMEIRFFLISNKVAQNMYSLAWHPGQEYLADYQSKHHIGHHHVAVRP